MLLFQALLLLLTAVRYVFAWRARGLERRYAQLAKQVAAAARDVPHKEGNSSRFDPFQAAKRTYQLGLLVERRDRLEELHHRWALRVERLNRWTARLRHWKGRLVPYALGAVDVLTMLCALDYFGQGEVVAVRRLVAVVTGKFTE
jgi:hypothetical protein